MTARHGRPLTLRPARKGTRSGGRRKRRRPFDCRSRYVGRMTASRGVDPAVLRVAREASETIGNTPMVEMRRLGEGLGAELVAKLEYLNPGGSVKDRIGVAMIDAAEREGLIEPGGSMIVEPTSGNTGIALALVCAARGYELVLTLPEGMTRERTALLRLYGAEVRETPSLGGMNEAVELARAHRRRPRARSCRSSSTTRPTPRSTAGPPPRRSGATSTARSTRSCAGSGPAARSPAWARC